MTLAKTEVQGIYKDGEGVLLNMDNTSLQNYKNKKALDRLREQKINNLEQEVGEIKNMLTEVMSILKGLDK